MKQKKQSEIILEQLESLPTDLSFLENVRQVNLDVSSQENLAILEKATDLLTAVIKFLRTSLIYLKKNFLRKSGETMIGKDDVVESKEEVHRAVDAFDRSVNRGTQVATLRKQQAEEQEKILRALSDMDFKKVQNDIQSRHLAGTCQWIFKEKEFDTWLNEGVSTLWCPGFPGVGKTILVSTILDHICPEYNRDTN